VVSFTSGPRPHPNFIEFLCRAAFGDRDGEVAGAGEDAAWASLNRLTAARGRRVATVPRLQDCRPRSVFEAGGPGSSLALAATNRFRATLQFY
jgi:hypothetical protein